MFNGINRKIMLELLNELFFRNFEVKLNILKA